MCIYHITNGSFDSQILTQLLTQIDKKKSLRNIYNAISIKNDGMKWAEDDNKRQRG